MKRGRIIIDGDPIIYRAAYASQTTVYHIVFEHMVEGTLVFERIPGDPRPRKSEMAVQGYLVNDQWTEVIPGDFRLTELAIDSQLKGIYRHCKEKMGGNPSTELILTGKDNYRFKIATIAEYKANRPPKPYYYAQAKAYLQKTWNAYTVDSREADDEVSIRARRAAEDKTPVIMSTIDKDLDQIPGWHYDYNNHVFYDVSAFDGMLLFYAQILSGDDTDNIPGLPGLGPKRSKALVDKWAGAFEGDPLLEEALWDGVVQEYRERGIKGYWHEVDGKRPAEDVALEIARLVKLQEYPRQLWTPPGQPDETIEGNEYD